jgi:hypothetical protein
VKPLTDFHLARRRRDGRQSYCKACRAEIDRARYLTRRDSGLTRKSGGRNDWNLALKAGRPCTDCGRVYPPQVMQWDHRPGTVKTGSIGRDLRGRPRQIILNEIAKCDLVCANCHAIRTFQRGPSVASTRRPSSPKRREATDALAVAPNPNGIFRRCARCGITKAEGAFPRSHTGQFSYCSECRREYDRRYYAEHGRMLRLVRQKAHKDEARGWLRAQKEGAACVDCHESFPACAMQWDHRPGERKLTEISRMAGRDRLVILDEIKKCDLVCANCHALRTASRASKNGTIDPRWMVKEMGPAYRIAS